ncbi:hypothetical protein [Limibacterium fermenti]|mgnify:FL=1|uniref:hypothetical protein n=1 Tax=Limibacterium fermenti TaxID=3229863 RepID=UPI000E86FB77|nr:hypothetical protein [Porphyromonadaceae bacterium]HBX45920.1 hypothetical protein [Porphyromonadaceae bacterium]
MERVIEISSREFREKQKAYLDLADSGAQIILKRGRKQAYKLTPVDDDSDFVITPELEKRLEEGRREYREGKAISCKTKEELHRFLDSL